MLFVVVVVVVKSLSGYCPYGGGGRGGDINVPKR